MNIKETAELINSTIRQKQATLQEIIKFKNAKFKVLKRSEHKLKYLEDLARISLANIFTDEGRKAIHDSESGYGVALIIELRLLDLLKKLRDILSPDL